MEEHPGQHVVKGGMRKEEGGDFGCGNVGVGLEEGELEKEEEQGEVEKPSEDSYHTTPFLHCKDLG